MTEQSSSVAGASDVPGSTDAGGASIWPERTNVGGVFTELTESADERRTISVAPSAAAAVGPEAVSGIWGYRHDWGNRNNQWKLNLAWGLVNRNSLVLVAIGEGAAGGGKFIGNAKYTLHNVAPYDGGVGIWVNIEWSYPIRLYVDYLVVNP